MQLLLILQYGQGYYWTISQVEGLANAKAPDSGWRSPGWQNVGTTQIRRNALSESRLYSF